MKFYHQLLASGLLASVATYAHAQTTPPLPPLRAPLDTVAVTGTTRVLTLAAAPGPEFLGFPLSPGVQRAVFYARPSAEHEYDLSAVHVLVSNQSNRSSTGQVLIDLVLPDSVTHSPTGRCLLPTPLVLTNREVRKAKQGLLTLDVRAYHPTIPAAGVFVRATGQTTPGHQFRGDTLLLTSKNARSVYVKVADQAHPGTLRVVNAVDFICIRDIRTTSQPQTWDYNNRTRTWQQRKAAYARCPQCAISNAGLELVVREL